jgi:glycosyltransferase involved in cell wall biosynthesis
MANNGKGRALFVLPADTLGGAERVCATLAQCAARSGNHSGIDVYVLSRPPSGSLDEIGATLGVSVIHSGAKRELTGLVPLARFVRGRRYALAFSTHIHVNAYLCLLRRCGVLATDRLVTREASPVQSFGTQQPSYFKAGLRLYGNQDLIICQTQLMAEALEHHTRNRLSGKIRVLSNFVDLERIGRQRDAPSPELDDISDDSLKIVWCGHLRAEKRPELAIQVLAELHRIGWTNAHLVMIGDGPMRSLVEAEIHRLQMHRTVTLCGFRKNPIALMSRCRLGLLTSDLEGFPNVILEMLAAGVQGVVTTDCAGGLRNLPNVLVCDSDEPAALALAVQQAERLFRGTVPMGMMADRSVESYLQAVAVG